MTERLRTLLREEADTLPVPPPPTGAILDAGRAGRRHRRWAAGLAAAAVVAGVATGGAAWRLAADDDAAPSPATQAPAPPVYGAGSTVVVGQEVVEVPGSVHSFHYTEAGVLVRSNENGGASDGSGPETLTLVRDDGSTRSLGTIPEGVGPATDPDEPVYVLAEKRGDGFVAVVRDAETGREVDALELPDLPPSYWEVPPLALDGEMLYVGYRESSVAIDLATREQSEPEGLFGGLPLVHGGRTVTENLTVVDVETGNLLRGVEEAGFGWGTLSPDGAFLEVASMPMDPAAGPEPTKVYSVATGRAVELPAGEGTWGWTSTGQVFRVRGTQVTTCSPAEGQCTESATPDGFSADAELKLGGRTYES